MATKDRKGNIKPTPKAFTSLQKKFLKALGAKQDLARAMIATNLSENRLKDWMKGNSRFRDIFYTKLGVTERMMQFLEIFARKAGNVNTTCKAVGISRRIYQYWKKDNECFSNMLYDCVEGLKDDVESQLLKNISKGKEASIIFYLKTKCKDRGYVEKAELSVQQTTVHSVQKLSDEELTAQINQLTKEQQKIIENG